MGSKLSQWVEESLATLQGLEAECEKRGAELANRQSTAESHRKKIAELGQQIAALQAERDQNTGSLTELTTRIKADADAIGDLEDDITAMHAALENVAGASSGTGGGGGGGGSKRERAPIPMPVDAADPKPPSGSAFAPPVKPETKPRASVVVASPAQQPEPAPAPKPASKPKPPPSSARAFSEPPALDTTDDSDLDVPRSGWRWVAVLAVLGLLVGGGYMAFQSGWLDGLLARVGPS